MVVGCELRTAISTESSGEEVTAQVRVVDTSEPRKGVVRCADLRLVGIFQRSRLHVAHVELTEGCVHVPS